MDVNASSPAQHRAAVAFCCDAGYLPFAALAARQIAAAHPDRSFDICLCSDGAIELPDSLAEPGLRRITIATRGRFTGLNLDARRTESAYLRLAVPEALSEDYDRILYLDADIWFRHGDIDRILALDLGGLAVAAVRDNVQWRSPDRRPEQFRRLGWQTAPYFNSGLLLIDVPGFLARDLTETCIDFGQTHAGTLVGHDQTLLNCVLRGDWAELSPLWNWQFTWASRLFALTEDAHLMHFIGAAKPWSADPGWMPRDLTRSYRDFFAAHFPDRAMPPSPRRPLADPREAIRALVKHAVSVRRMARYLGRFDGSYDVIAPAGAR